MMSFEETEENFKNRMLLNHQVVNFSLKGIEANRRHLKMETVSNVLLSRVVFIMPTLKGIVKPDTCKKIKEVIEIEETQALFSPNYLNVSSSDKSKIFTSTEQTSCIDRIIVALKNKCSIKNGLDKSFHLVLFLRLLSWLVMDFRKGGKSGVNFFESSLLCFASHFYFVWDFVIKTTQGG